MPIRQKTFYSDSKYYPQWIISMEVYQAAVDLVCLFDILDESEEGEQGEKEKIIAQTEKISEHLRAITKETKTNGYLGIPES